MTFAIALSLTVACSSSEPAERVDTYYAETVRVDPGGESVLCTYVRGNNEVEEDAARFETFQSPGGHHIIVYAVDHAIDLPPSPCSQGGQADWSQLIGSQSEQETHSFPPGVGYRLAPHQQFVIETHFINTGAEAVEVQSGFRVDYADAGAITERAAVFYVGTYNIDLAPNGPGRAAVSCRLPVDVQLHTMLGHQHARGTGVQVGLTRAGGDREQIYQSSDWEDPGVTYFEGGLSLAPSDAIDVGCDWHNTTSERLRYPSEMCIAAGYYWPAQGTLRCGSGGRKDECICLVTGAGGVGAGGSRVEVSVARAEEIPGVVGALDDGAPIYCLLFAPEDWAGIQPVEGAMWRYIGDAVGVSLETSSDAAVIAFDDVAPGEYVAACMMDTIGGGPMPGTGNPVALSAPRFTASAGNTAEVSAILDFAVP